MCDFFGAEHCDGVVLVKRAFLEEAKALLKEVKVIFVSFFVVVRTVSLWALIAV